MSYDPQRVTASPNRAPRLMPVPNAIEGILVIIDNMDGEQREQLSADWLARVHSGMADCRAAGRPA